MNEPIDLSIIIPAYKEADRIEASLKLLADHVKDNEYGRVEVVVMAQTDDDTGAAAKHDAKYFHDFRVVSLGQRAGKGAAVRAGMFEARGKYRMFMDADMATPLRHLDDVHSLMQRGAKVGIAVRHLAKIHKGFARKLMTKGGNILAQIVLLPGIEDTQCGFKVFEATAAEEIFSRQTIKGWGFDMEILKIARSLGYRIETFVADDWKDPKTVGLVGDSNLGSAVQVLRDLIYIRLKSWTGQYKKKTFHYEPQQSN